MKDDFKIIGTIFVIVSIFGISCVTIDAIMDLFGNKVAILTVMGTIGISGLVMIKGRNKIAKFFEPEINNTFDI